MFNIGNIITNTNKLTYEQSFEVAAKYCGYLEKKSPSIFTGYQKR